MSFIIKLIILLLVYIIGLILKPLYLIIKYQLKYGNQCFCYYFPILGFNFLVKQSTRQHKHPYYVIQQIMQQNPNTKMIVSNLGVQNWFIMLSPEAVKNYTIDNIEKYQRWIPVFQKNHIKLGLLASGGGKWKFQRVLLSKPFHFEEIKKQTNLVTSIVNSVLDDFQREYVGQQKPAKIIQLGKLIATEVGVMSFFGTKFLDKQIDGQYFGVFLGDMVSKVFSHSRFNIWFLLQLSILGTEHTDWFMSKTERDILDEILKFEKHSLQIVEQRLETRRKQRKDPSKTNENSNNGAMMNLLDWLIEEYLNQQENPVKDPQTQITKNELLQQCMSFQVGASDNSGVLIAFLAYTASQYPKQADRVLEEINNSQIDLKNLSYDDLNKLPVTNAFVQETIRHYGHSNGTFNSRKVVIPHKNDDIPMPMGALISVIRKGADCNPQFYPQPEEFQIDRWLQGEINYTYIFSPFSAGAHNCLGQHLAMMEFQIFLINFVKRFRSQLNPDVPLELRVDLQIQPEREELIFIEQRNN